MSFVEDIKKVHGPRFHKFTRSYGLRDYYNHYKKTHSTNLSSKEYSAIVRDIFSSLIEKELLNMFPICLPYKMGYIEVNILKPKVVSTNGEYRYIAPVDWKKTLALWEKDEEAHNNKTLVYTNAIKTSVINYVKEAASFKNQLYFYMQPARKLKEHVHYILFNSNLFNIQ